MLLHVIKSSSAGKTVLFKAQLVLDVATATVNCQQDGLSLIRAGVLRLEVIDSENGFAEVGLLIIFSGLNKFGIFK